jgi:DNA-binding MarR family transcriptional regulator
MPYNKPDANKPLGWYLKEADQLITISFEEEFDKHCITRFHWMILRILAVKKELDINLHYNDVKFFLSLDRLKGVIDNLETRGWVTSVKKDTYKLTEVGHKHYTEVDSAYQEKLKQMMKGISEDEYNTTVKTLNNIVLNLRTK